MPWTCCLPPQSTSIFLVILTVTRKPYSCNGSVGHQIPFYLINLSIFPCYSFRGSSWNCHCLLFHSPNSTYFIFRPFRLRLLPFEHQRHEPQLSPDMFSSPYHFCLACYLFDLDQSVWEIPLYFTHIRHHYIFWFVSIPYLPFSISHTISSAISYVPRHTTTPCIRSVLAQGIHSQYVQLFRQIRNTFGTIGHSFISPMQMPICSPRLILCRHNVTFSPSLAVLSSSNPTCVLLLLPLCSSSLSILRHTPSALFVCLLVPFARLIWSSLLPSFKQRLLLLILFTLLYVFRQTILLSSYIILYANHSPITPLLTFTLFKYIVST